jgi:hypothetical protein
VRIGFGRYIDADTNINFYLSGGTPFRSSKSSMITSGLMVRVEYRGCIFFSIFTCCPLSTPDNLKNGKFHQHLRDIFAPQVVRYVDLMESSIAQSIHKGFEKEKWEIKG